MDFKKTEIYKGYEIEACKICEFLMRKMHKEIFFGEDVNRAFRINVISTSIKEELEFVFNVGFVGKNYVGKKIVREYIKSLKWYKIILRPSDCEVFLCETLKSKKIVCHDVEKDVLRGNPFNIIAWCNIIAEKEKHEGDRK